MSTDVKNDQVRLGVTVVCNPLEVGGNQSPALLDQLQRALGRTSRSG